jgi:hypothetical protein
MYVGGNTRVTDSTQPGCSGAQQAVSGDAACSRGFSVELEIEAGTLTQRARIFANTLDFIGLLM